MRLWPQKGAGKMALTRRGGYAYAYKRRHRPMSFVRRPERAHMEEHEQGKRSAVLGDAPHRPTLVAGSEDGTVALLRARTGAVIWRTASRREVGMSAHDGARYYVALGGRLRLIRGSRYETLDQQLRLGR